MSELEDKLNKILSSPENMARVMEMAKALSSSMPKNENGGAEVPPEQGFASAAETLGGIDPKMFKIMSSVLAEYSSGKNDKTALLSALAPYLKEERRESVKQAASIAKIAHAAKAAFTEMGGGGSNV